MTHALWNLRRLAVLTAGLATLASPALAGPTLTFALNQISDSSIGTGTLGTVVLMQNSATVVDVTVSISPALFINTGGKHTPFAFNTALTGLSVNFITPTNGTYAAGTFSLNASGGENTPYGYFDYAMDSTAGNGSDKGYGGTLEFTVTRADGIDTTDFAAKDDGFYFSVDMSNGVDTGAVATLGDVNSSGGNTNPAPEPASLVLLGSGLIGLGALRRRKHSA
jgi:hypothetical protein